MSILVKAIERHDDAISPMPPKENDKLDAATVTAFRDWIDGGAPWPDAAKIDAIRAKAKPVGIIWKTSGGLSDDWTKRTYAPENLWAYQPLARPALPGGAKNPVDAFLNVSMKVSPAPLADRRTLIRRATFDLTGLPPSPAEVEAFLKDPSNDETAFTKVIDRLLASPHYGEQMARHWLDLVRYADSAGFSNDYERGSAWRYRDYVVRAFNTDKPYDRFVREQIAGDEIDANDAEMLVATGFLRMGAWELTGMEVPKIARQRFLDDTTDTVGQVFLGQMLQCARCHDHKFDPVPTRDYYRIQAAFAASQIAERPAPFLDWEARPDASQKKYLDLRKAHLEGELKRIQKAESEARAKWLAANPDKKGQKPPRHEFLSAADLGKERIARKGLERLAWEYDRFEPVVHGVYSGPTPKLTAIYKPFRMPNAPAGDVDASFILVGGDPYSPGQPVKPGVLSAVGDLDLPMTGRRKALAEWITKADHPLTARVMVNRLWLWTMGQPLAGNPNNFGGTGKKPTHPELFDWLAGEFIANGYSVKKLQRTILLSEAYRRSSRHPDPKQLAEQDPLKTSYAVFQPRRLTAEELRDAMLAASGELNRRVGGVPVRPEINPDVAFEPRQVMGTFAPAWEPSPKAMDRHRRTLYALRLRGLRDPFLEVFNAPTPELSCELRETAIVAPQAFALFNGEATRRRALALAMTIDESNNEESTIKELFQKLFQRFPTDEEKKLCLDHWHAMTQRHKSIIIAKESAKTEIEREAVEENTGERFRFTEPLFALRDFEPDAHPADANTRLRGLMEVAIVLLNTNEFAWRD
jgi:hypothetical protein